MLRCVIFDFDGTLADSLPLCLRAFRETAMTLAGIVVTDEDIKRHFGPSEAGTLHGLMPDHPEALDWYMRRCRELHPAMCPDLTPGLREVILRIRTRGIRTAVLTGRCDETMMQGLEETHSRELFEDFEGGSPAEPCKPEKLRLMMNRMQLKPDEVLYVGDSVSDVTACREAGVRVAGAVWASSTNASVLAAAHPDWLVETPQQLEKIINTLSSEAHN